MIDGEPEVSGPKIGDDVDPYAHLFDSIPDEKVAGFSGYKKPYFYGTEDMQLDVES